MAHTWSEEQERIFYWFSKRADERYADVFPGDPHGNLTVVARAGTGKTTVIIEGVKRAPERSIWVAAFSKEIQLELERRLGKSYPHISAKTIHSVGLSCIRRFRNNIKVDFSSYRADSLTDKVCGISVPDAVKKLVTKLHTKGREVAPHATVFGELTEVQIQFECEPDEQWRNSGFDAKFIELKALEAMELASQVQNGDTIDGSDMIFLPVRNRWLTKLYNLVVIDEAQDMTTTQLEICLGVLMDGGRIAVIGDNRQAIFAWRGADSNSIDRLTEELGSAVLGLKTTYRCGKVIVARAQELVPDFVAGPNNPEGEILEIHSNDLVECAGPSDFILSRVNAPLVSIAMKLLRAGKRTRVRGRDIGKGLVTLIRKLRGRSVPDLLARIEAWTAKEVVRLNAQMEQAVNGRKNTIKAKIEEVNDRADMLISLTDGAKSVTEVEERIVALFEDDGLGDAGMIMCSSIHRAKGLEARRVFVLQDTLRNYNIEEQNIEYVAITRAKESLVWVSDHFVKDEPCKHQWEEQAGEPPVDVCISCGEVRR